MTATISTPSTIARRVEDAANAMSLPGDGFQRFENGTGLVMGTPAAATVVFTVLVVTSTQFTSAFIGGGADRESSYCPPRAC